NIIRELATFPTRRSTYLRRSVIGQGQRNLDGKGRQRRAGYYRPCTHESGSGGGGAARTGDGAQRPARRHKRTEITGNQGRMTVRSEEHTSELQSRENLVC